LVFSEYGEAPMDDVRVRWEAAQAGRFLFRGASESVAHVLAGRVSYSRGPVILKVDIDRRRFPGDLHARIRFLCVALHCGCRGYEIFRTEHGWHLRIDVTVRLSPPGIVAAQSILGSDWKREAYNLMRARRLPRTDLYWRSRWNTLYDTHTRGMA
jgi:hypothetical protein